MVRPRFHIVLSVPGNLHHYKLHRCFCCAVIPPRVYPLYAPTAYWSDCRSLHHPPPVPPRGAVPLPAPPGPLLPLGRDRHGPVSGNDLRVCREPQADVGRYRSSWQRRSARFSLTLGTRREILRDQVILVSVILALFWYYFDVAASQKAARCSFSAYCPVVIRFSVVPEML